MGYTHYWTQTRSFTESEWSIISGVLFFLAVKSHVPIGGTDGTRGSAPMFAPDHFAFNGIGKDAHETFWVNREIDGDGWSFCKTARKPYDRVVVACLIFLAAKWGFNVESDGDKADWAEGLALVSAALPDFTFAIPANIGDPT